MESTYLWLAEFAQTWGLAYFVAICFAAFAWTLWPTRKAQFERAAHIPLLED